MKITKEDVLDIVEIVGCMAGSVATVALISVGVSTINNPLVRGFATVGAIGAGTVASVPIGKSIRKDVEDAWSYVDFVKNVMNKNKEEA